MGTNQDPTLKKKYGNALASLKQDYAEMSNMPWPLLLCEAGIGRYPEIITLSRLLEKPADELSCKAGSETNKL